MQLKRMTFVRYIIRTALLAWPAGILLGIILYNLHSLIWSLVIGFIVAVLAGVGISTRNYIQLILPVKAVMERLEQLAQKSGHKEANIATVNDLELVFSQIIKNLSDRMESQLHKSIYQLQEITSATSSGAEATANSINHVLETAEEISSSVEEYVSEINQVEQRLHNNSKNLGVISDKVMNIALKNTDAVNAINELKEQGREIVKVLELINRISSQTNLLSLNASIEAAKAGDAGRGFTVVANEIGELANRSIGASSEIGSIVNNITIKTDQTAEFIDQFANRINSEVQEITGITSEIDDLSRVVADFLHRLKKIPDLVNQIVHPLQNILAAAEETSAATQEVTLVVDQIERMVKDIKEIAH